MSPSTTRAVIVIVLVSLVQGMIGVMVKWIDWPPVAIVAGRCLIASPCLWCLVLLRRKVASKTEAGTHWAKRLLPVTLGGVLLGAHWATLFWGYHVSQVGPVVVALFTFPIMASIAEPFFFSHRPIFAQVLIALLGAIGVAQMTFAAPDQGASSETWTLGIVLGLLSAALWAARGIQARALLRHTDAVTLMAVQTTVAGLLLSPALLTVSSFWESTSWGLIVILGILFTALPHTLVVWSLQSLSFSAASIIGSLQVLSAVLLAQWLLGETPTGGVWWGALLVCFAVGLESLRALTSRKKSGS